MMYHVSEADHCALVTSCLLMVQAPHLSVPWCASASSFVHVFSGFLLLYLFHGVHSAPPIGRSRRKRCRPGKSYRLLILLGIVFKTSKIVHAWTMTLDSLTARFENEMCSWLLDAGHHFHFHFSFLFFRVPSEDTPFNPYVLMKYFFSPSLVC